MIDVLSLPPGETGAVRLAAVMAFTFAAAFCLVLAIGAHIRRKTAFKRRSMLGPGSSARPTGAEEGGPGTENVLGYESIVSTSELLGEAERNNAANQSDGA